MKGDGDPLGTDMAVTKEGGTHPTGMYCCYQLRFDTG